MKKIETPLSGAFILEPEVYGDARGFFMDTFSRKDMEALGLARTWDQDSHSLSVKGTLRGLHWQVRKPQAKMARVVSGAAFDVAVDLRRKSPTFGCWTSVELSAENKRIFFIPEGFAHGFFALTDKLELLYKFSEGYSPEDSRGLIWNDPRVGIRWPLQGQAPLLSPRDGLWKTLEQVPEKDLF